MLKKDNRPKHFSEDSGGMVPERAMPVDKSTVSNNTDPILDDHPASRWIPVALKLALSSEADAQI